MSAFERDALSLATNGFEVFPIKPGEKRPPLVRFTAAASADPVEVAAHWGRYPNANIGVRPGGGTLIFDADTYKDPGLDDLIDELRIPPTTEVRSPRGGRHLYLTGQVRSRTDVRPGLDVKAGIGAYALGPGSVVNDRRYEWVIPPWEIAPQPAPEVLLDLLRATERSKFQAFDSSPILKNTRNSKLTRIGGWFIGQGVRGEPLRVALQAVNKARCKPPLSEKEVDQIVTSANRWDRPPLWLVDPMRFSEDPRLDGKARHVLTALAARARYDGRVRGGEWIGEVTGWSKKTIYRAVVELEDAHRIRVSRARAQGKANDYLLLPFLLPTPSTTGKGVPVRDYPQGVKGTRLPH